jgi:hypothetical protein
MGKDPHTAPERSRIAWTSRDILARPLQGDLVPRTRKPLVRLASVGILASALAFAAATPAFAFGPADVTVTPSTTGEDPLTTVAIVCPSPSDTVTSTWSGTDSGAPISYGGAPDPLDAAGEFSDDYYFESFFDRDTDATLSIECFDGATSTGTDSVVYHLPTTGAVAFAAASRGVNQDLVVTGNCGTAVSIDAIVLNAYQEPADTLIAGFPMTVPYTNAADFSVVVGTGNSLAVPVGDSIDVSVACRSTAPTSHGTSNRITSTLMTAAVTAPPAAAPGSGLAATGVDLGMPIIAASVLVVTGAGLLLVRRRRAAHLG